MHSSQNTRKTLLMMQSSVAELHCVMDLSKRRAYFTVSSASASLPQFSTAHINEAIAEFDRVCSTLRGKALSLLELSSSSSNRVTVVSRYLK
jgi:hypothetical protein